VHLENVQGLDNTPAPKKTVSHSQAQALAILMRMLTDFAIPNDGFFGLSAKLIINTTDLLTVVRNKGRVAGKWEWAHLLDPWTSEVKCAFQHPDSELYLTGRFFCILPARNHV